jgi:transposase
MSLPGWSRSDWDDLGVARDYRPVDRDQRFLLVPDMRDWLAEDHLVWLVLDAVAALDTSALHARYRRGGVGRAAYDPEMLLALVIYAWSQGVRSSRRIQRLCAVDVALRVICAGDVPDHSTVCRFIAGCQDVVGGLFSQVLVACRRLGLVRLGTVAIDGTKIAANGSLLANRTQVGIEKELARLAEAERAAAAGQAAAVVAEQIATDAAEDDQFGPGRVGDELPAGLADPRSRKAHLQAALAEVKRRTPPPPPAPAPRPEVVATGRRQGGRAPKGVDRVAEAEAVLAHRLAQASARYERLMAARAERAAAGLPLDGRVPNPPHTHQPVVRAQASLDNAKAAAATTAARRAAQPPAETKVNITDPDSRIMKTRGGWVQGYNCQLATTADQIILAATATCDPTDVGHFTPMADQAAAAAAALPVSLTKQVPTRIATLLADAGYDSDANLTHPGPDRLIATGTRHDLHRRPEPTGPLPTDATARQTMNHRLATPTGRALYKRRGATVEPSIGQIKDVTGLRRFRRRGLPAAHAELTLTCMIHNLLKVHRAQAPAHSLSAALAPA